MMFSTWLTLWTSVVDSNALSTTAPVSILKAGTFGPNRRLKRANNYNNYYYVLLVLSPMLAQKIKNPVGEDVLHMEKGKYYVNGIVNYIHPPKFIPVFLNGYFQPIITSGFPLNFECIQSITWISPSFALFSYRSLAEGSPENVLHKMLRVALSDENSRWWLSLWVISVMKLIHFH